MTFTGPPLVLLPSFNGPCLYRGALHSCIQVLVFISTTQYAIIGTRIDFLSLKAHWADHLLG